MPVFLIPAAGNRLISERMIILNLWKYPVLKWVQIKEENLFCIYPVSNDDTVIVNLTEEVVKNNHGQNAGKFFPPVVNNICLSTAYMLEWKRRENMVMSFYDEWIHAAINRKWTQVLQIKCFYVWLIRGKSQV